MLKCLNKVGTLAKHAAHVAKIHTPAILTGVGIAGYLAEIPLTIRAVRKVDKQLEEHVCTFGDLSGTEKVKVTAKAFWPVAVVAVGSTAAVIGGHVEQLRRMDALKGLLISAQGEVATYKKAIDEHLSAKKKEEVEAAVERDKIEKILSDGNEETVVREDGVHFIDMWSGTKFKSTFSAIESAFAEFAYDIINGDGMACMNTLRYRLGLDPIGVGDIMYFTAHDYGAEALKPEFTNRSPIEIDGTIYIPLYYSYDPTEWAYK